MNRSLHILLLLLPFNVVLSQTIPISNTENDQVSKSVVPTPTASMTISLDSTKVTTFSKPKKTKNKWNKTAFLIGSSVFLTRIGFHIRWLIIKNQEE